MLITILFYIITINVTKLLQLESFFNIIFMPTMESNHYTYTKYYRDTKYIRYKTKN